MCGDCRIPLGGPIASRVAGTWTDEERRPRRVDEAFGVSNGIRRQRRIPMGRAGCDSAGPHEAEEGVQHVFADGRRNLRIGEKPLQFARARAVETQLDRRPHQARDQARAKRQLQIEQQIEAAAGERRAQPQQLAGHCALVEGDKLDFGNDCRHQLGLEFADDPGESSAGPRCLQRSQRSQRVACIADGRETQETDVLRRRIEAVCHRKSLCLWTR